MTNYFSEKQWSATQLLLFRGLFFFSVGWNALLMVEKSSRYGVAGWNVSHVPWLDFLLPTPTRPAILIMLMASAYFSLLHAAGWLSKWTMAVLALLLGTTYFISQLDSYQHHYLVFLYIFILAIGTKENKMAPWAIRLLLVQTAIVYFWAFIAKCNGEWMSGDALIAQFNPKSTLAALMEPLGLSPTKHFAFVAKLIAITELGLALALAWGKPSRMVATIGIAFHLLIELSGFEIGMFSFIMMSVYVLLWPKRDRQWSVAIPSLPRPLLFVAAGLCPLLLFFIPINEIVVVSVLSAAVGLWLVRTTGSWLPHVFAIGSICTIFWISDVSFQYHKKWGGVARRTLGYTPQGIKEQKTAYRALISIRPSYGRAYYHLGRIQEWEAGQNANKLATAAALYEKAYWRKKEDRKACASAKRLWLKLQKDTSADLLHCHKN